MTPFDRDNPRALINLVPRDIQKQLEAMSEDDYGIREEEFERKYGRVDIFCNRVRIEFWREFEEAQQSFRPIEMGNIAFRCGAPLAHVDRVMKSPVKLAWVMIPPGTYDSFLDEALLFGLMRVRRDILDAPIYDNEGNFDVKAADLLLKAVAFFDMRKNGGILNKSVQIVKHTTELKNLTAGRSIQDIEARIKELEAKGVVEKAIGMTSNAQLSTQTSIQANAQPNVQSNAQSNVQRVPTVKDAIASLSMNVPIMPMVHTPEVVDGEDE